MAPFPYVSYADVLNGALLAAPAGSGYVTFNDSYENIPNIITKAFPDGLAAGELTRLTSAVYGDLTQNEFADGPELQAPVVLGVLPLVPGSNTFSAWYSKGEFYPGGKTTFKIKAGRTIVKIIISAPEVGLIYSLDKESGKRINNAYQQSPIDNGGYKDVAIAAAAWDGMNGFGGSRKVITVFTDAETFIAADKSYNVMT